MSTWLPSFLQPLLLIPYYKSRLAESLQSLITGGNDQVFGPLEQAVAAVVVIALATQTPPNVWTQSRPHSSADIGHASNTTNASPTPSYPHLDGSLRLLKDAFDQYTPSPATFVLVTLLLNIVLLLLPADLKQRLRNSWKLFWPPWQQRGQSSETKEEQPWPRDMPTQAKGSSGSSERQTRPEGSSRKTDVAANANAKSRREDKDQEKMKNLTDEQKAKLRVLQEERAKQAAEGDKVKVKDKAKDPVKEDTPPKSDSKSVEPSEKTGDDKLSQSERARKIKEGADKGKARMADERPADRASTTTAATPETEESGTDTERSGPDTDDPLMAGDYRPLKSVLKKSKKKPRQKKNIHHNYYMTMRGYKPSLIPFPHGFHPKPHHPRNTLWFDNIPKNADHIMAPPPVPKAPEKDEDGNGDDGKKGDEKEKSKDDDKKSKEDEKKSKDGESRAEAKKDGKSDGKASASSKVKSDADKKDPARPDEAEKAKAEGGAKAKAKAEAEAKLKAKQKAEAEAKAKPKAQSQAGPSGKPAPVPVNPQIQKATYIAQALLCVLLYLVNEQLGFLLLAFFAYQHISRQYSVASDTPPRSTSEEARPSTRTSSKAAPTEPGDKTNKKPDERPEGRASTDNFTATPAKASSSSRKSEAVPEAPPEGASDDPGQDVSNKPRIPTRLAELTPEQQQRYKLLLEQKRRQGQRIKFTNEGDAQQVGDDGEYEGKGKERATSGAKEPKARASRPKEGMRYEDLTDDQKAEYLRVRAKRKAQEKDKTKLGQGSGLSADEKAALSRPSSPAT